MTTSNWIELGILFSAVIIGIIPVIKSKRAVDDIEGFVGVLKKEKMKGNVIGGETEDKHRKNKRKTK